MSAKTSTPHNDPDRDPLLRVQLTLPRWLCWMLAGVVIGRLNDIGPVLHVLGQLVT